MKKALVTFGLCFILFCTGIYLVNPPKAKSPATAAASSWDDWAHLPDPGGSGIGTESSPFIIRNATDLSNRLPTASNAAQNQHFILMSDITLSGDWNPRFLTSGSVFDGNNYRISGLRIRQAAATSAGRSNRGFFNTAAGTVKNLIFVNPDVNSAGNFIAVVAATVPVASSVARFNRVFVEGGSVSGTTSVGGIVGQLSDNANAITYFENCFNSANITASGAGHAGGMLGRSGSSGGTSSTGTELYVSHCGNEGSITANSTNSDTASGVGGIVGCIDGGPTTVKFSYNTGTVTGHAGIVGLVRVDSGKVSISNCFNDAGILNGNNMTANSRSTSTRYRAAIVVRANANTEIWAENNWYNTRLFSGHAYARGHTPDAGTSIVGGDILEPGRFTDIAGQGAVGSLDISAQDGKEALLDFLNTGSEIGTGFAIISGQIRLLSLTRTRTITFLPMGAPGNAFQRHLSPDDLDDFVLPTVGETRIGHRFGFMFDGWKYNGNTYTVGFNFPLSSTSPMNIEFEAVWSKIDYTVIFHESPTALLVGASIPPVFNIGQGGLSLAASNWDLLNRPVWMIKKAGTEFPAGNDASWVPLSNANGFPFSQKVLEDADGIAFLTNYADTNNNVMIKLVSHNSINSHLINVTSENEDGGTFGFTLTGSNSVIQVSLSFGYFSISNTSTIDKLHIETKNDYYEFVRIEVEPVTGSPFTLSTPDANGFLYGDFSGLVTGAQIHVVFAKIPFKLDIITNLVTEQYPKPEVPATLLNNRSLANVLVDESTNIFVEAKQESFSGLNAFRFIGFKISTAEGEFVPIPFTTTTENYGELFTVINSTEWVDAGWLDNYLYEDKNLGKIVRIIAEYIPLYRVIIGGGDVLSVDGTIVSVGGTFDVIYSYYDAVDAITVWPLDNTFFVPEGSTINIETRTNIFFENAATDSSFFYHLTRFDGLFDGERVYTMGDSTIATLYVNTIRTVNPVFTPRPFNVTFEARDSNGKTIPNVSPRDFSIVKVSPEHAAQLRIGDIFTAQAPNLPALSGYRFEGFSVIGITDYLPSNFHIDSENFFLDNLNSHTLNVLITARYTNLFDLKVGVASGSIDMGQVKVYKGAEKPENLVYDGSGRDSNGNLPLLGQFEQSETFIIVAVPSHGFEFASFSGIYADGTENHDAGNKLIIEITEIRTITANFRALPITINEKLTKKGWGTTSAEIEDQLFAGGKIYIFANPGFGSEVKSWSINGVNIKKLGNVERFDNMIEVTLTSEWLYENRNSDELKSHVKFGFTLTFVLLVIVPSILIPLLGLAFLAYFLNLQRKKKIIKAALLADKRARAGFNQHSLVVDAREGNAIGGVSDEAVKAVMKAKKKKKDKNKN